MNEKDNLDYEREIYYRTMNRYTAPERSLYSSVCLFFASVALIIGGLLYPIYCLLTVGNVPPFAWHISGFILLGLISFFCSPWFCVTLLIASLLEIFVGIFFIPHIVFHWEGEHVLGLYILSCLIAVSLEVSKHMLLAWRRQSTPKNLARLK